MLKRIGLYLFFFLLLLGGVVFSLPPILSTAWGTHLLVQFCNRTLDGKIQIQKLTLSFFGTQKIEGLEVADRSSNFVLSAPKITSDQNLFSILLFHQFGTCEIPKPVCTFKGIPQKISFLSKRPLQNASLSPIQLEIPLKFQGTLKMTEGECRIIGTNPITFSDMNALLTSDGNSHLQFHVGCQAEQGRVLINGNMITEGETPQLKVEGSIQALPMAGIDRVVSQWQPESQGLLTAALGPTLDADLHLLWEKETFTLHTALTAENLKIIMDAAGQGGMITLKEPATIDYTLPQTFVSKLSPSVRTNAPLTMHIEMDTLSCPLLPSRLDLSKLQGKGSLAISSTPLVMNGKRLNTPPIAGSFVLHDGKTTLKILGEGGSLEGSVPLHIQPFETLITIDQLSPLKVNIEIPSLTIADAHGAMKARGIKIPVTGTQSAFSCAFENTGSIAHLFGNTLQLQGYFSEELLSCAITSPLFNLSTEIHKKGNVFSIKGNHNQLSWNLSPQGYDTLMSYLHASEKSLFKLLEPTLLMIKIPEAEISDTPSVLNLDIQDQKLHFLNRQTQEEIVVSGSHLLLSQKLGTPLTFDLSADVAGGSLRATGNLPPSFASDPKNWNIAIDLSLKQFPTAPFDIAFHSLGGENLPFRAIFGQNIQAMLHVSIQDLTGPISLTVQSPQTRLSLIGKLSNGVLSLNETTYLQGMISPEMSRLFLKKLNPLSISSIQSEGPITFEIPKEGFSLPLFPLDLAHAQIPKGRLELGRIHCHNEGNVKIALSLLKSHYAENGGDLPLWFAPLDWKLSQGVVSIERTEILLADSLDVAIWGNVDLVKNYVDMILGLTREALAKAFGIHDLPENYVLLIPMKGKMDDVEINSGGATTKIALLLAWQKQILSQGFGTGNAGKLVEGLLGAIATLPDQNANVPNAKHPFPWEQESRKRKTAAEGKPKKFKPKENSFKQLLKILK